VPDSLTLPRPRRRKAPAAVPAAPAGHARRHAPAGSGSESVALCLIAICSLALGIWLPVSHYVLGYPFVEAAEDAFFTELLAGVIVGCAGYGRLQSPLQLPKLTALQAIAGAWLLAAPWVVGYAGQVPAARVNDVLCGVTAVLLAAAAAVFSHRERRPARSTPMARPPADDLGGDADLSPEITRMHERRPEHAGVG
jgi:peptidoglycan/LPS O-acetylase OafA/YrhL